MPIVFALLLLQDAAAILHDLGADEVEVREAATEILLRLPPAAAAPIIVRALESEDLEVRARARRAWNLHNPAQRPCVHIDDEIIDYGFGVATATVHVIGRRGPDRRSLWRALIRGSDPP